MATARKHWFRISDSILREPWPRDAKLTMVMLCAWLNQRWARDGLSAEEAGRATLTRAALAEITGRVQLRHAVNSLRVLAEYVSISIRVDGEFVFIDWPKFAEFQGLASRDGEKSGRKTPPPHTHTQDAPADAERERGADAPRAFSEGDDGAWTTQLLALRAKSTRAEARTWVEANFQRIAASARYEAGDEASPDALRNKGLSILHASWSAYLRERDPTKRDAAREASAREKRAVLEASKAAEAAPARASPSTDGDDPLADLLPFRTREVAP